MLLTQNEAEGFRRITYFSDRPDIMSTYNVTLIADKDEYPILLSNGNLINKKELKNNKHMTVWEDSFAKPCYLFAIVAGNLEYMEDYFVTKSNKKITLRIYSEHGNINRCLWAMEALKNSFKWDEERFNLEYDLDLFNIVATRKFNMGAMENKSLNIFNSSYVYADKNTATDQDFERIESVIAHEYFHNWTGNRVTCRDWFQLSLKEGLTVFRDEEFSSSMRSHSVNRIKNVEFLRKNQFTEDKSGMAHPIRPDKYIKIDNFYTHTIYMKGAEVIRMMHTILGEERFRKGFELYINRHDGQAVTCDDFIKSMEDANNYKFNNFKLWYSQAGTPNINANWQYDKNKKEFKLTLTQKTPDTPGQKNKLPLLMPIKCALIETEKEKKYT